MRLNIHAGFAAILCTTAAAANDIEPGIYTNEEEVYFDALANRPIAPWTSIIVERHTNGNLITFVDAFGKPWLLAPVRPDIVAKSPERLDFHMPNGRTTELRRARPVTCWVAIRKETPKPDGSKDWHFVRDVKLHDQGGRATVGGGETGTQPVMIRVRNITWDKGSTNAPVITLYIHKPENWDRAESYSWAAPDSARVGINLRWVQAGCTIDGNGTPSMLSSNLFKNNEEAKAK